MIKIPSALPGYTTERRYNAIISFSTISDWNKEDMGHRFGSMPTWLGTKCIIQGLWLRLAFLSYWSTRLHLQRAKVARLPVIKLLTSESADSFHTKATAHLFRQESMARATGGTSPCGLNWDSRRKQEVCGSSQPGSRSTFLMPRCINPQYVLYHVRDARWRSS